jgi:hypothetical protein
MTTITSFSPDPAAEQREVDRMSLRVARMGLAEARAKGLPFSTQMYRRSVVTLYLRIRRQRRPA